MSNKDPEEFKSSLDYKINKFEARIVMAILIGIMLVFSLYTCSDKRSIDIELKNIEAQLAGCFETTDRVVYKLSLLKVYDCANHYNYKDEL